MQHQVQKNASKSYATVGVYTRDVNCVKGDSNVYVSIEGNYTTEENKLNENATKVLDTMCLAIQHLNLMWK